MIRARALNPVETAEVVARYAMGSSLPSVARTMKTSVSAVRRALLREGVELRAPGCPDARPDHLTTSIVRMRGLGYSWHDIGQAVGMPATTARHRYTTYVRRRAAESER